METFKLKNLTYFYPDQKTPALKDICLQVKEGDFILMVGPSGSGKTTLTRILGGLIPQFYGGTIAGEANFNNESLFRLQKDKLRRNIGMVFQDPEKQILMNEVERDLAFGVENLGLEQKVMHRRIVETSNFLNLSKLRKRLTNTLSSGEKQKVAIGSVLAMLPQILILDEPSSQLDPASAREIFSILTTLHCEYAQVIILIEQRLEHCFSAANRILLLDEGKIILDDTPSSFALKAAARYPQFVPTVARLFAPKKAASIPLTIVQARPALRRFFENAEMNVPLENNQPRALSKVFLTVKNISFSYSDTAEIPVLNNINFTLSGGEFVTLLGENGAGKSTLLKIIAGLLKPKNGDVLIDGLNIRVLNNVERAKKIAYLSQNPNDYLFNDTVEEELLYTMRHLGLSDKNVIHELLESLELGSHRNDYPRALSAGERQRVALAAIMVGNPSLIMLDEPTRGLDLELKRKLGEMLQRYIAQKNAGIILVTQDVEFAAEFSTRAILLSEGQMIEDGNPQDVFHNNLFYSTQVNKLFRGIVDRVVNFRQADQILRKSRNG